MPLAEAVNEGSGEPPCSALKKEDFAALRFVNWTRKFSEFWKIRNSESRVKKNWKRLLPSLQRKIWSDVAGVSAFGRQTPVAGDRANLLENLEAGHSRTS